MADTIYIRAGDTEPLILSLSATGLTDLTDLTTAVLYARKKGATTNHVDGGTLAKTSGLSLSFDPVGQKSGGGNAFDAAGQYECYILATWSDADTTRHPGDGEITVVVRHAYE